MNLMPDEKFEILDEEGLAVIQSVNGYHFTSDAVCLAKFVSVKKNDTVVEFCSGSGVISLLIQKQFSPKKIFCFEVQSKVAQMSKRSAFHNGFEEKIEIINDKLQNCENYLKKQTVDVIVCNPPYIKANSGKSSASDENSISRIELEVTLEEIIFYSNKILKDNGKIFISMIPSRLVELISKMKKFNIEPKKILFNLPNNLNEPSCVFVQGVKNANEGVRISINKID